VAGEIWRDLRHGPATLDPDAAAAVALGPGEPMRSPQAAGDALACLVDIGLVAVDGSGLRRVGDVPRGPVAGTRRAAACAARAERAVAVLDRAAALRFDGPAISCGNGGAGG
jgi:hypothetical protein